MILNNIISELFILNDKICPDYRMSYCPESGSPFALQIIACKIILLEHNLR